MAMTGTSSRTSRLSGQRRKTVRPKLLSYYGHTCFHCGQTLTKETLTIDHVLPVRDGGRWLFANLIPACQPCNLARGSRHLPYLLPDISRAILLQAHQEMTDPIFRERPPKPRKRKKRKRIQVFKKGRGEWRTAF